MALGIHGLSEWPYLCLGLGEGTLPSFQPYMEARCSHKAEERQLDSMKGDFPGVGVGDREAVVKPDHLTLG